MPEFEGERGMPRGDDMTHIGRVPERGGSNMKSGEARVSVLVMAVVVLLTGAARGEEPVGAPAEAKHAEAVVEQPGADAGTAAEAEPKPEFLTAENMESAGHDAEATQPQSWGAYEAPTLKVAEQPALKSGAMGTLGQGGTKKTESEGALTQVLGGLALGAVVVTLLLAARASRMKRADGTSVRALTVSAKLVLGFGALTAATMAVGMMAQRSQSQVVKAGLEVERVQEQERALAMVGGGATGVRLAVSEYLAEPTDARHEAARKAVGELAQALGSVEGNGAKELTAVFGELVDGAQESVTLHDEREGTFRSQLLPTAMFITKELSEMAGGTKDVAAKGLLAMSDAQYQKARIGLFKFLRSNKGADIDEAKGLCEKAVASMEGAKRSGLSKPERERVQACLDAAAFWVNRLDRIREVGAQRDEAIEKRLTAAEGHLETLVVGQEKELHALQERSAAEQAAAVRSSGMMMLGVIGLAVVLAAGIGTAIVKSIGRGMRPVVETLARVAKGDLTVAPINSEARDELGELSRSVDAMVAGVRDVLMEVATSTQDVSAAATEIAASAEQMSCSVSEVARQAQEAAKAADGAGGSAKTGGEVVGKTVESMKKIHSSVELTAKNITELGEKSEEIGRVIEVINDIAEQTNLLALNAAIEAARAGVHGRGFAVVADEVRKLAERTTKATEEVTSSIEAIQQQTTTAVSAMHEGTALVGGGVRFAGEAKTNLESIVGGASTVASMIRAITAAGEEAGAGASQSAAAAGQLSAKAEELRVMVGRFKMSK